MPKVFIFKEKLYKTETNVSKMIKFGANEIIQTVQIKLKYYASRQFLSCFEFKIYLSGFVILFYVVMVTGIQLLNVEKADSGNYSVYIGYKDTNTQIFQTIEDYIYLQIGGK